jgi:hypothetical protein
MASDFVHCSSWQPFEYSAHRQGDGTPNYRNWSIHSGVGGSSFVSGRPDDWLGIYVL